MEVPDQGKNGLACFGFKGNSASSFGLETAGPGSTQIQEPKAASRHSRLQRAQKPVHGLAAPSVLRAPGPKLSQRLRRSIAGTVGQGRIGGHLKGHGDALRPCERAIYQVEEGTWNFVRPVNLADDDNIAS
jgi:hypothetical protein